MREYRAVAIIQKIEKARHKRCVCGVKCASVCCLRARNSTQKSAVNRELIHSRNAKIVVTLSRGLFIISDSTVRAEKESDKFVTLR